MQKELQFLEEQEVSPVLIGQVEAFRKEYPVHEAVKNRISEPKDSFLWERNSGDGHGGAAPRIQSAAPRRKGLRQKYFWRKNLAWMFGRPSTIFPLLYNIRTAGP